MEITGDFSLKIISTKLDINLITSNINIQPSIILRKGDEYKLGKLIVLTENDCIYYTVEFDEKTSPELALKELLDKLTPYKEYIKVLANTECVVIRWSIQSTMAQIYYNFPSELLKE